MDVSLCRPAVLGPAVLVVGFLLYHLLRPSRLPDIPIVGAEPGEWFPLLRARWRNLRDPKTACNLAYTKYRNQACIVPIASAHDFVHLPLNELQWLLDEPEHSVSALELTKDTLQTSLTVMDPELVQKPVHNNLVPTVLTRETGNLIPTLYDEIEHSVSEFWGAQPGETREVCVYASTQRIIGRVTNRIFVGLPLCRSDALLDNGVAFAQDLPLASTLLKLVWRPLRPLAALLVTLPTRIHTNRFYKVVRPEVEKRLREYDDVHRANPETKATAEEPNDFLQWSIHQAKASQDPYLGKVDTLAGRILLMNFASIHTSSFAISHVLFDLASSKPAYIEELRVEIATVLAAHGGRWSKGALAAMHKLDSTMRESQRLNSFIPLATNRLVTNPGGLTTPSGLHLPAGTAVCSPAYASMHDEALYEEAGAFRPFRFAEGRRGADEGPHATKARRAWAAVSPEYMAFGLGRHACPGRFFAACELKLMLAYVLMNYEFETLENRPASVWLGMNRLPPMKATLRVRRRDK